MIVKFVKTSEIKKQISNMLSSKNSSKIVVLGSIDDYSFDIFKNKVDMLKLFISVDKRYITYNMLEGLLNKENVYIYDNNLHKDMKKENIILGIDDNEVEILISAFEFTKDNFENSDSTSIYIKGNKNSSEMQDVMRLYDYYENNENYEKLNKDILDEIEKNKGFRNNKINTIFNEMQIDEVISSFRNKEKAYKNIYQSEDKQITDDEIDIEINID